MPKPQIRSPQPLARWRLYPDRARSALYAMAYVWRTYADYCAAKRADGSRVSRGERAHFQGFVVERYDGTRWRRKPCIGALHFYRARLGTEVVSHEMTHAALAYCRRRRIDLARVAADDGRVAEEEEHLCYAVGRLSRAFVARAIAAGFYEGSAGK